MTLRRCLLVLAWLGGLDSAGLTFAQSLKTYDMVIQGGRVMDPASGLDAPRNIGIQQGRISTMTPRPISGRDTIQARGLVVAPGFIDLHSHGQNDGSYRYYAMDGVTTALEMEGGIGDVDLFYARREGNAVVNFGGTAVWAHARRIAVGEPVDWDERWIDTREGWAHAPTTPALLEVVRRELMRSLERGALGIGMGIAYAPGADSREVQANFELCAERQVVCFTHIRQALGIEEVLFDAPLTGASLHVVHIDSTGGLRALEGIRRARARGLNVTTEAYPYTATSARIQSALYDSVLFQPDFDFSRIIWAATGEHLTRESFERYRREGGIVIRLGGPDSLLYPIFADTSVMVASDAVPCVNHRGHPRLAGTHARVLGRYVRDARVLPLMDALRRMTIMPARRLEASVPQMRLKGRLTADADADLTVFDPARVIDRATYEEPAQGSAGILHVLVSGVPVVRDGVFRDSVFPGQAIRQDVTGSSSSVVERGPPAAGMRAPQCSIDAVAADPSPSDSAYPPEMHTVRIPSGGVHLNGVLYLAQGAGPHPTAVFLHGFPGDEKNLDLAQAVRRAGLNALVFYYRGAWGSPGDFSRVHALEDMVATLAWLRAPATLDSLRVDPARLILVGHSFGGFAALYTAARSDAVAAVAALAPADLGKRGAALRDPAVFAREAKRRAGQIGALRGTSGDALGRELMTHADEWSLLRHANALARRRVLLVAAAQDEAVPLTEAYEPLGAKLREAGARELTTLILPSDHAFSSARVSLAQALTRWLCEAR